MMKVGIRSQTLDIATTTMIPKSARPICTQSIRALGSISSIAPMSFENRLSTRPEELVLKNRIVARIMQRNIRSWSLIDDFIHIEKKENERMSVMTIVKTVKPE